MHHNTKYDISDISTEKLTSDNSCELKSALKINNISSVTLIRKISLESNNLHLQNITVADEIICLEEREEFRNKCLRRNKMVAKCINSRANDFCGTNCDPIVTVSKPNS